MKCLCEREDPSSIPNTHIKSQHGAMHFLVPELEKQKREAPRGFWTSQPSLIDETQVTVRESFPQKTKVELGRMAWKAHAFVLQA